MAILLHSIISYADIHVSSPFLEANKHFGTENITVIFWWSEDKGVLYDVVVSPQAFKIYNSSTSIALTMQYNVLYNVTVSLTLCGHILTDTLELNYGELILDSIVQKLTDIRVLCSQMQLSFTDG